MPSPRPRSSPDGSGGPFVRNPFRREFKRAVRRDLEDLYGYYVDEESRTRLARMRRIKRVLVLVWWLMKSLLRKLSPVRRTLLIASLLCLVIGYVSLRSGDSEIHVNLYIPSIILLLFIVMLELKDKLVVREEMEVGRAVQVALLPDRDPVLPGWEIRMLSRPANDVGGDLADYIVLSDTRLGLALGDIAGKGLGAALLMAKLQATLRTIAPDFLSLAELGSRTNRIFCRDCEPDCFATLVYAVVEAESNQVRILNAGHPPPIAVHRQGIEVLPPAALPIGMLAEAAYAEQRLAIEPGEFLLLYSDGLTEAADREGAFFGEERLMELVSRFRGSSADSALELLLAEIDRFQGDAQARDDLSLALLYRIQSPLQSDPRVV